MRKELDDQRRECRRMRQEQISDLQDIERYTDKTCTSNIQFGDRLICSTTIGVCNRSCPANNPTCTTVCTGTCVRGNNFSFDFTNNTNMNNCSIFVCKDGTQFSSCNGHNSASCSNHGGSAGGYIVK